MNAAAVVVFVMLVNTYGGNWIPTLEFNTEAACIKAASDIKRAVNTRRSFVAGDMPMTMCVRLEK